ncbi:MAG: hypothetical protein A2X05_13420 [Bacteroidetes bacterium GWE2_41_25]|nr:MAG: hypothetical protein A2X03_14280 [Bacteroidetes bacterium GWA2_40_15]OFX91009.1 MAG: hypothetical protein A2X06_04235 [Bacteroidetes bacterium GWC2_40_22]OFY13375.1 MAG: hypothetical protein A2X05_13420 [Bacteroidetes bacterium GWE2_41_25]OFY61963.1 MAG: hypothetical protein A2X04_03190 [Bacteroidetes bacterium GWF2_41_9]HAM10638.1 hypothetical protein [Bacteroidales bacterium]
MKNLTLLFIFAVLFTTFSCNKDAESERFKLLTTPTWSSDSLLANGADASGPGGFLEDFKGDAKFNKDGTGYFGIYEGTWRFAYDETQIVIETDSLPIPLTTQIAELTASSLKITTSFPNIVTGIPIKIRMTFKAK